ncbi:DUF4123 domain-containing protein [Eleftheria terrae]|uniref:DUF4123 domain-containing protein n=1 Tax=Eleftheria terrae TaxID=1597781 RepID=UPI00263AD835|nr:DUF4123 domain-containing protein [Eleftheria terrae]WKB55659.1 hypothetical protein N7L95_26680 [Eleftheria terrae]
MNLDTVIVTAFDTDTVLETDSITGAAAPAGDAALSLAEFREALWRDPQLRVYAVLQASRMPGVLDRLAAARQAGELPGYECLARGALDDSRAAQAAYLLALAPQSAFTDWLLAAAAPAQGDWGVLLRSPLAPLAMRAWARDRVQAVLPDGQAIALDWLDPALLRELLPLADRAQEAELFDGLASLWWNTGATWTHHRMSHGRRRTERHEVAT